MVVVGATVVVVVRAVVVVVVGGLDVVVLPGVDLGFDFDLVVVDVVGGGLDVVVGGFVVVGLVGGALVVVEPPEPVAPTVPRFSFAGAVWKLNTLTRPARVPAMTIGDLLIAGAHSPRRISLVTQAP